MQFRHDWANSDRLFAGGVSRELVLSRMMRSFSETESPDQTKG
jgi:hypothetical protein